MELRSGASGSHLAPGPREAKVRTALSEGAERGTVRCEPRAGPHPSYVSPVKNCEHSSPRKIDGIRRPDVLRDRLESSTDAGREACVVRHAWSSCERCMLVAPQKFV